MKRSIKPKIDYHNYFFKLAFSFTIAYLIVGQGKTLTSDLLNVKFGRALFINFLMIFLLISIVSNLTYKLDYHYPWRKNYIKRIFLQLLLGILAPFLPVITAVSWYFSLHGIVIWNTGFFEMYLQQLLMALVGINFYLYYDGKKGRSSKPEIIHCSKQHEQP